MLGRPSTTTGCYLRLIFLKFRYRLGYESDRRERGLPADAGLPAGATRLASMHDPGARPIREGRISYLERGFGWDRTRLDGRKGAAIWCGHGVFAHNLVKIGTLAS